MYKYSIEYILEWKNKMMCQISEKIRTLRKENNLTLKDLSEKTGLSVSFLSQVENGTSSLAIVSLKKIADALCVPINNFFTNHQNHNFLVKSEDHHKFKLEGSNTEFVVLSGEFEERTLESMMVTIPPESRHGQKFKHPGEEFIYVLEGLLIVNLDGKEYLLKKGDSIHHPSNLNHFWVNPTKENTKLLSVLTPVLF